MTLEELLVCQPLPQFFLSAENHKRGGLYHVVHLNAHHTNEVIIQTYFVGQDRRQLLRMYDFGLN